jgi:hypothetical protein
VKFNFKKIILAMFGFWSLFSFAQIFVPFSFWANNESLKISPSTAIVAVSATQQFYASGGFSLKTFAVASGVGSINATTGLYTAPGSTGTAVVSVTDGQGTVVYANVSVVSSVTGISVSQSVVSGGVGAGIQITAQATYTPTGSIDVTNSAVWTTSNAAVATVVNGMISYIAAGTATVTATYGGFSQNISVTVSAKTLTSISVTPMTYSMPASATFQFTATATYSDTSTQNITTSTTWSSSNPSIATISNSSPTIGLATGIASGVSTVAASFAGFSATSTLTINAATLSSIEITPDDYLGFSGMNLPFTATGTYSDSSTANITSQVTWSSSNTSAATISNITGTNGLATAPSFTGYRSTVITAALGAVSDTTPLGVNGVVITSVLVKPTVTITAGSTYQLQAWGNTADGGVIDITQYAVWSSGTTSAVTVSNGLGTKGVVTGVSTGTSSITATISGISGSRTVTVGAVPAVTDVGNGITGNYYNWTGGAPPAAPFIPANKQGTRIDAKINFAWGSGAAPMGVSDFFAVQWNGFYKATSTTNYFCAYSDDGIRVYLNGSLIINNWTLHGPTWNCTANIPLTIGTKYTLVMEFFENGGGAESHLTRSSTSAAAAQNLANVIPQVDLYSY